MASGLKSQHQDQNQDQEYINVNGWPWSADTEMIKLDLRLKSFWTSCFVSQCRCYQQHSHLCFYLQISRIWIGPDPGTCWWIGISCIKPDPFLILVLFALSSPVVKNSPLWSVKNPGPPNTGSDSVLLQTQFVSAALSIYYYKPVHRIWIGSDPGCYDELWCLFVCSGLCR